MEEIETIAQRDVVCVNRAGEAQTVKIKISRPRSVNQLWETYVEMEGLYDKTFLIKGVDSFQAICLAMGFVRNALEKYLEEGGRLLWSDQSGEINLDTMFS
ncbi:MAG: hypothetical protein LJE85_16450 [Gammaproteobacteria bacterium]|nr:hypothetical protein [Gammaproteobacteria bacterium]